MQDIKTIAIVAGEHSGDNYGALLISQLKTVYPNAKFIGVGSHKMLAAGLISVFPLEKLSIIGFINILKKLPELIRLKNKLIKTLLESHIDLYIGIDAPEFNLVVARKIKKIALKKKLNIKIFQYISPTVWAWRPKRIYKVAKATDSVLCIFPFEEQIYRDKNISAYFVGHPLGDVLHRRTDLEKSFEQAKISEIINININHNQNIISLFPGSRASELNSLSNTFLETAEKLSKKNNNYIFLVPLVSEKLAHIWDSIYYIYLNARGYQYKLRIYPIKLYLYSDKINSHSIMRASDLILCASGTTTLEAFILGVRMVVAYKVSKFNELLFRLLIKIPYIAMPNILSNIKYNQPLVPEFLQDQVTSDNLCVAVEKELHKNDLDNKWVELKDYICPSNISHSETVLKTIQKVYQDANTEQ
ncbi:MAG: lipid-A-disaccharide synthase [Gammaproteobacteria bacterium]|nr:lipid-A-disaccharide synthase [Gammaproteobacteria bacterium]